MKRSFSMFLMLLCLAITGCNDDGAPSTSSFSVPPVDQGRLWLLHSPPEKYYEDPKVIALCEAVRRQRILEVALLLKQGVDVNAIGKRGVRPVACCLPMSGDCFELLVRNGADLDFRLEVSFSGSPTLGEMTPLTVAALYFCAADFAFTLDHTKDSNLASPRNGPRPLSWAVATASQDSAVKVRLLLCKGATVNIPDEDPPILIKAIVARKFDAALVLMEHGADVSVKDRKGADVTTLVQAALQDKKCTYLDRIRLEAILDHLKPVTPG